MVQQGAEEESWEDAGVAELQKLSIKQHDEAQPEAQAATTSGVPSSAAEEQERRPPPPVDPAIIEALQRGREADRKTITDVENMVIKFIGDTARDLLEFPASFGTYQKMLAHRVAQAYGLQTSTVDYEDGFGRVIGSRTKDTRLRKVRLTKIDLSAPEYQVREPQGSAGAPKVLFRRPGGPGDHGRGPPSGDYKANFSAQSMKEREEDYNRARERLGIAEPPPPAYGVRPQMYPPGAGRGFPGGRGPMVQGRGDPAGRGRGRKAVFRDRDRELQDPDYVRGFNRDGSQQPYENQGYEMEGYSEYPMQPWSGGPYRAPPPPPPPHPSSPYAGSGPNHKGSASTMQAQATPGMAMYPAGAPGMPQVVGQPQMAAMARPPFSTAIPMSPYGMPAYPGHMGYPGQQAMYAQGMAHPYSAQMGAAAYAGYMDASGATDMSSMAAAAAHGHAQGMYPMYATGYALYPPAHMAAAMQGGVRAMAMPGMSPPGAGGMEHMYHHAAAVAGQYGGYPGGPHGPSHEGKGSRAASGHNSGSHAVQHAAADTGGSRHDSGSNAQ